MHLIGAGQVFISGGDHGAVGVFQPVQPVFQPLHRDAAQIDDIAAHQPLIRADERIHHIAVFQKRFRFRQNAVPHVLIYHLSRASQPRPWAKSFHFPTFYHEAWAPL